MTSPLPANHSSLAGSGEVKAVRLHGSLAPGSTWEADERVLGQSFVARSQCLTLVEGEEISWRSFPPPLRKGDDDSVSDVRWWFRLEPAGSGTRVVHSFRVVAPKSRGWMLRVVYALSRRPGKIRTGMRRTLENLAVASRGATE